MSKSPNRLLATVFGIVYVLVGIAGFFVTSGVGFFDTSGGLLLGIFEVNILHNVAHMLIGAALLIAGLVRRAPGQDRQLGDRRRVPAARHRRAVHRRERVQHPGDQRRRQRAALRQRRAAAGGRPRRRPQRKGRDRLSGTRREGDERERSGPRPGWGSSPWAPGSIHLALVIGSPPAGRHPAASLVGDRRVRVGRVRLHRAGAAPSPGRARRRRIVPILGWVALLAASGTLGTRSSAACACCRCWSPACSTWSVAIGITAVLRRDPAATRPVPLRPARYLLGLGAGALVVAALTTPALAATEAGDFAQPHGTQDQPFELNLPGGHGGPLDLGSPNLEGAPCPSCPSPRLFASAPGRGTARARAPASCPT